MIKNRNVFSISVYNVDTMDGIDFNDEIKWVQKSFHLEFRVSAVANVNAKLSGNMT